MKQEIVNNQHNNLDFKSYKSNQNDYISVPQFYENRSIFITGSTGFLGKVLLEKLIRSCPKIKNIYLLIRPKRGNDIHSRLNRIISSPLFDKIRHEEPSSLNKIIPIYGDIEVEKLGIAEDDEDLLCQRVSVVFHSAATIKFNEPLKRSLSINTLGTKRIVELCRKMKSLDALVYISTVFCNCDRSEIKEIVYALPYNFKDIIKQIESMPDNLIEKETPFLIGKRPNTYTLTKALTEQYIQTDASDLPVTIVRPSGVISSVKEPFPGWVDAWNGPTGIAYFRAIGIAKIVKANESLILDVIPVDIVVNLTIASAWRLGTRSNKNLIIYNCVSGNQNAINYGDTFSLCTKYAKKYPIENSFYYPVELMLNKQPYYSILKFFLEKIPIYLIDFFLWLSRKNIRLGPVSEKYYKLVEQLEYFSGNQWKFHDENVQKLFTTLSTDDRKLFNFDIKNVSWKDYFDPFVLGYRTYLLKQDPKSIPKCRQTLKKLNWIHISVLLFLISILLYIFYKVYFCIFDIKAIT